MIGTLKCHQLQVERVWMINGWNYPKMSVGKNLLFTYKYTVTRGYFDPDFLNLLQKVASTVSKYFWYILVWSIAIHSIRKVHAKSLLVYLYTFSIPMKLRQSCPVGWGNIDPTLILCRMSKIDLHWGKINTHMCLFKKVQQLGFTLTDFDHDLLTTYM